MSAYEGGQNHLPDIPAERWRAMYMEAAAELERLRADLARARESALKRGGRYNWRGQPERLVYLRKFNGWHQFALVGERDVWCEVLDQDLHMLEETGADHE